MKETSRKAYHATRKLIWITLGFIALILGIIGIPLPLLPTTPFLLLAAFCFNKGSDRLQNWLMSYPVFAKPITDWNENGVISRKSKIVAVSSMAGVFTISLIFFDLPIYALAGQAVILSCVAIFLLTRPEKPKQKDT